MGEAEVQPIFGFPRGDVVISRRNKYVKSKLLNKWRADFGKDRHDVTPAEVSDFIQQDLDGGL